jgi:hypothetical protein
LGNETAEFEFHSGHAEFFGGFRNFGNWPFVGRRHFRSIGRAEQRGYQSGAREPDYQHALPVEIETWPHFALTSSSLAEFRGALAQF